MSERVLRRLLLAIEATSIRPDEQKPGVVQELADAMVEAQDHLIPCPARLWHGPGHQSSTACEVRGQHDVHEALGSEWRGDTGYTGAFNEPVYVEGD